MLLAYSSLIRHNNISLKEPNLVLVEVLKVFIQLKVHKEPSGHA